MLNQVRQFGKCLKNPINDDKLLTGKIECFVGNIDLTNKGLQHIVLT